MTASSSVIRLIPGLGRRAAAQRRAACGSLGRRLLLGLSIVALVTLPFVPRWIGEWLVLSEPLQQADAVVVLGGQLPYRALEAARIFREGWAQEAWVTAAPSAETEELRRMQIGYLAEHEWNQRVLEHQGVPPESIRVLADTINTTEEVEAILRRLEATGGRRAIVVSSKFHARRIRVTWDTLCKDGRQAVVRYTPEDTYSAGSWWANTRDLLATTRELGGIVNVWLGFPLRTRRSQLQIGARM